MGKLSKSEISDYEYNNAIRVVLYLAYIVIGVVLFSKSYIGLNTITKAMGITFIITGTVYVWMCSKEKHLKLSNFDLIFGILAAVSGLLMIVNPGKVTNSFNLYFSIFLFVCALQKLVVGIKLFKIKDKVAAITTFSAFLIFVLGLALIFNIYGNLNYSELAGLYSVFFGLIQLISTSLINNREKNIIKNN